MMLSGRRAYTPGIDRHRAGLRDSFRILLKSENPSARHRTDPKNRQTKTSRPGAPSTRVGQGLSQMSRQ